MPKKSNKEFPDLIVHMEKKDYEALKWLQDHAYYLDKHTILPPRQY
jgi:hypothetical protein